MSLSNDPFKWLQNAIARGNVRMLRESIGLDLDQAADEARVPRHYVDGWEHGDAPDAAYGSRYARWLVAAARKPCSTCGQVRDANEYWVTRDGENARLHSQCIPCRSAKQSERWKATETEERKKAERERIRTYQQDPGVKERRAKRSAAQYRALTALKEKYPEEYKILGGSKADYAALAGLRETHRGEYEDVYRRELADAGLERVPA
jgi:transcriptional regulator with XRE-family HTH domain